MIRNFITAPAQSLENSHEGQGPYTLFEIWDKSDFSSDIDFFDRMVIPPGSTVGYHRHGPNEEMYIVLEGNGMMSIDGEDKSIKKGDMILNPPGGAHGLVNNSDGDIDLLIIQMSLPG